MNAVLWAVAAVLAAAFTVAGVNHGLRPKEQLKAQMPWTEDFSQGQLRGSARAFGSPPGSLRLTSARTANTEVNSS